MLAVTTRTFSGRSCIRSQRPSSPTERFVGRFAQRIPPWRHEEQKSLRGQGHGRAVPPGQSRMQLQIVTTRSHNWLSRVLSNQSCLSRSRGGLGPGRLNLSPLAASACGRGKLRVTSSCRFSVRTLPWLWIRDRRAGPGHGGSCRRANGTPQHAMTVFTGPGRAHDMQRMDRGPVRVTVTAIQAGPGYPGRVTEAVSRSMPGAGPQPGPELQLHPWLASEVLPLASWTLPWAKLTRLNESCNWPLTKSTQQLKIEMPQACSPTNCIFSIRRVPGSLKPSTSATWLARSKVSTSSIELLTSLLKSIKESLCNSKTPSPSHFKPEWILVSLASSGSRFELLGILEAL